MGPAAVEEDAAGLRALDMVPVEEAPALEDDEQARDVGGNVKAIHLADDVRHPGRRSRQVALAADLARDFGGVNPHHLRQRAPLGEGRAVVRLQKGLGAAEPGGLDRHGRAPDTAVAVTGDDGAGGRRGVSLPGEPADGVGRGGARGGRGRKQAGEGERNRRGPGTGDARSQALAANLRVSIAARSTAFQQAF